MSSLTINRYYTTQRANNKTTDQTVRMHRMVCTFVIRGMQQTHFEYYFISEKINKLIGNMQ